jgi:glycosyltransferase involved in cell wall biosynthesis
MRSSLWVLTEEYEPHIIGGLGTVATHLTRALAQQGLDVTVISRSPSAKPADRKEGNVRVIRIPAGFTTEKIISMITRKKLGTPDIVHIHSLEFAHLALYIKRKWKIPYIYTLHSVVARNRQNRIYSRSNQQRLLRSAKMVVVPSEWERAAVIRAYPFCAGKILVIPHGVRVARGISRASKFRLLYAGRLIPKKGIYQLVNAMKILRRKYPKAKLYIIGKDTSAVARAFKRRVQRSSLSGSVFWLGFYPHRRLLKAYRRFGAVVVPSRRESFGLTALEALASGVPLVSTRAGGLRQFVSPKVAQVIPRVSAASIAAAIEAMWKSPVTTRQRVLAGKKIAAAYNWSKAARRYRKLLTGGGA